MWKIMEREDVQNGYEKVLFEKILKYPKMDIT